MITSPLFGAERLWALTLDRICYDLNLEWYYDQTSYRVVFERKRVENTMLHDLEMCFGDTVNLKLSVDRGVLMKMRYDETRAMLKSWVETGRRWC